MTIQRMDHVGVVVDDLEAELERRPHRHGPKAMIPQQEADVLVTGHQKPQRCHHHPRPLEGRGAPLLIAIPEARRQDVAEREVHLGDEGHRLTVVLQHRHHQLWFKPDERTVRPTRRTASLPTLHIAFAQASVWCVAVVQTSSGVTISR